MPCAPTSKPAAARRYPPSALQTAERLHHDKGARTLGELALGTNYPIRQYTRNTLFDEKIGGTCHLALGAAYPKTGGKNESALP
jgi:aminopeptidase